jgi:hypothetical protein
LPELTSTFRTLVPGDVLDADEEAETVTYRLADGRTWIDGRDEAAAPVENAEALETEPANEGRGYRRRDALSARRARRAPARERR